MSSNVDFIRQPNVQLLWDIISEQFVLDTKPERVRKDIYNVLTQNIRGFYTNENEKIGSLVGLNKKYIAMLVQYINTNFSNKTQSDKLTNFEQDLKQKQSEFSHLMTLPVPPVPNFKDDATEYIPMSDMEVAIKKASEQRNYDLEVINATRQNAPSQTGKLKTALPPQIRINENLDSRVLSRDIIDLNNSTLPKNEKHISWSHIKEEEEQVSNEISALFNKLKKVQNVSPSEEIDRIQVLESKIDLILELLKGYKSVFSNESTSSSL